MERGSSRYKTMEKKNRKSCSTIFYLTFTPVQQGTRKKSTIMLSHDRHVMLNEDGNVILQHLHLINTSDRKHNKALPIPDHSVAPLLCPLLPNFSDSAYTVDFQGTDHSQNPPAITRILHTSCLSGSVICCE